MKIGPFQGNPYNHHQAITNPEYFVGREKELEDIKYDLSQAHGGKYINIGITGKEGAGKSSLSYMVEHIADEFGYTTVRVNLDKSITNSELMLFKIIYESLVEEVGGDVEESYIKAMAGRIDQLEVNLKFVRAYLTNEYSGRNQNISEGFVKHDFKELFEQSGSEAIMVTIDNAQHLSENPISLQKMKNIFSELQGYILVLVGTEDTFGNIDDVFSPTARMFNKFRVSEFESIEETKECVLNPLSDEEVSKFQPGAVEEIHKITGGRPYEVNLICYYVYREYERGSNDKISLSSEAIDSVVDQIDTWRRPVNDELLNKINNLSKAELRVLISSLECPSVDKDSLKKYSVLTSEPLLEIQDQERALENNSNIIENLIEMEVFEQNNGIIMFAGNQYCLAYAKYLSYSKRVLESLGEVSQGKPGDIIVNIHHHFVDGLLLHDQQETHSHFMPDEESSKAVYKSIVPKGDDQVPTSSLDSGSGLSDVEIYEVHDEEYFQKSIPSDDSDNFYPPDQRMALRFNVEWLDEGYLAIIHSESTDEINNIRTRIESLDGKLQELGINLLFENEVTLVEKASRDMRRNDIESGIEKLKSAIEVNPNDPIPHYHLTEALFFGEKLEEALEEAKVTCELKSDWAELRITKGAIHCSLGEINKAKQEFEVAVELEPENQHVWAEIVHYLDITEYYEEALEFGERGLENGMDNGHLRYHVATVNQGLGNFNRAMKILDELEEEESGSWRQHGMIRRAKSSVLSEMGENEEALELASEWTDHESGLSLYGRAVLEARAGNEDDAISYLEEAIELDPTLQRDLTNSSEFTELEEKEGYKKLLE